MRKRGQVTAFIILGVIIVALVAIGIYYRDSLMESLSSIGVVGGVKVPEEFQEINFYVEDCVNDISEDGIRLLGLQAGYLSIPEDSIPAGPANLFSNRLGVFPNGHMEVPYWFYVTANNIPRDATPSIGSMEQGLATYIDSNLDDCIDNFTEFDRFKIAPRNHKTSVKIKKDAVDVEVSFPITAELDDKVYNFKEFKVEVPAALGKLYSMALQIQDSENTDYFLEDKTYDVLVLYEEIPLSETDFSCSPRIWSKTKVTEDFKRFLSYNVPAIKVKGADYNMLPGRKYFEWGALETSYPDTSVNFMYSSSWPIYLDVVPAEGDVLKGDEFLRENAGEALSYLSSFVCINQYHFIYDIKHPVLVVLHDDESFGGRGLDFQFATMVVIDNNQPRENTAQDLGIPDDVTTNEICKYASSKITINVLRPSFGAFVPVPDADVSYKCITSLCDIGKTGSDGSITANFPACINGAVIAKKDGFHQGKTTLSTNEPASTSVIIEPYYDLNVDVRVLSPSPRIPLATEKIVFNFVNEEAGYSTSFIYPDDKKLKLISGDYEVTSYVVEESPFEITIQGQDVEHCTTVPKGILGIFGVEEEKCSSVNIPPTKLKTLIKGGANFKFTVNRNDLASATRVVLYTVSEKTPSTYEELADVYSSLQEQKSYFIYPRFER
ncbi:MAG: hypothetical protein ABIH63_03535 [archaeon]